MNFLFNGNIEDLKECIGLMKVEPLFGAYLAERTLEVNVEKSQEGLYVTYDGDKTASIGYSRRVEFIRALSLLAEGVEKGRPLIISEKACFKTTGVMLDCSRNAVPRIESVKILLRKMALMGLNALMLYTEDTFEVQNEPYFGYMRGRYTSEELKSCDDYAYALGIELIPCIQTLGHLETFLRWENASRLRDTGEVLLVDSEETYLFLKKLIMSAMAPYRSRRIHIGMDEAHGLGLGRYIHNNGYSEKHILMKKHLEKIMGITSEMGLAPMIWGDMYFRMSIQGEGYYDMDVKLSDKVREAVLPGVENIYWDYYHNDEEFYSTYLEHYKSLGSMPAFCGGMCTWLGMFPDHGKTMLAGTAALKACKKAGLDNVFTSTWNDTGEGIYHAIFPGLQLYAEMTYSDTLDEARLKERIKYCTGIAYEDFQALGSFNQIGGDNEYLNSLEPSNPQRYLLWQDILLGFFDKHIEGMDTFAYYDSLEKILTDSRNKYKHIPEMAAVFDLGARLADVLKLKADLGLRLKKAYDTNDREGLVAMSVKELPSLSEKVIFLREAHREIWFNTYKPFGWEPMDIKYGGILMRIETAVKRLSDYLGGTVTKIEELEEERLSFDGFVHDKIPGCYNQYIRMVTAGNLW